MQNDPFMQLITENYYLIVAVLGVTLILLDFFLISEDVPTNRNEHFSASQRTVEEDIHMPVDENTPFKYLAKNDFKGDLVLFFDIDGVLHPYQTETLELKGKLLVLTNMFPDLELIMCSDWRLSLPREWFEKSFGDGLAERFKGCTPVLPRGEFKRQNEVETFSKIYKVRKYVVVDDRPDLYRPGFPNLVTTSVSIGMTEETVQQIATLLGGSDTDLTKSTASNANEHTITLPFPPSIQ